MQRVLRPLTMKSTNSLAASRFFVVFAMLILFGIHRVAPFLSGESPGSAKKPMSLMYSGNFSLIPASTHVRHGVVHSLTGGNHLHRIVIGGCHRILVDQALFIHLLNLPRIL